MEYVRNSAEDNTIRYAIYGFGRFAEDAILSAFELTKHAKLIASNEPPPYRAEKSG